MTRSIWDELKPGKLDERARDLAELIAGGHRRGPEIYILYRSRPYPPHVSRKPAFDKGGLRVFDAVFAKFTYIRRPYVERTDPPSVRTGKRLVLYAPTRPEVRAIKNAGARRHRIHGVYTIPREKMTPELIKFMGSKAKTRFLRIVNRRAAPPSAAARFQRYIDGPIKPKDGKAGTRIEEVNGVPSLLGNIGTDRAERAKSWTSFVAGLDRANARFQYRILLMLPPSFTPEERYAAVEEFARRLFEPKGIRWSAAIHRPVLRSTTDEATPHAHILFEPLGKDRMRELRKEEDRVYLRLGWPAEIKKAAAEAFNEVYWRKERRVGLEKGTPVFMTIDPAKPTGKPEASPRQWRHDEKQKTAGLPTVSQRKALLEPGAMPAWMSIDPILPTLEAIPKLLTVLVPSRQPHDPTIEKALSHLRSWAEKLIEKVLEEVRQAFEVATYLSMPLRTPHSDLLNRVFEQFRGVDWQSSSDRYSNPTGFRDLEYKKWREKRFRGEIERELAGTIGAIEETEGRHFVSVREMRWQLVAYHKFMTRGLEARRPAIEALTNTIRYLDSLTLQKSSQSYEWWPYASMATSGVGAAFWFKEDERAVYIEGYGPPRKATLGTDGNLAFPTHRKSEEDPWLGVIGEREVARVRDLWKSAVVQSRMMVRENVRQQQAQPVYRPEGPATPVRPAAGQSEHSASSRLTVGAVALTNTSPQSQGVVSAQPAAAQSSAAAPSLAMPKALSDAAEQAGTGRSVADAIAAHRQKKREDRSW